MLTEPADEFEFHPSNLSGATWHDHKRWLQLSRSERSTLLPQRCLIGVIRLGGYVEMAKERVLAAEDVELQLAHLSEIGPRNDVLDILRRSGFPLVHAD